MNLSIDIDRHMDLRALKLTRGSLKSLADGFARCCCTPQDRATLRPTSHHISSRATALRL